MNAVRASRFLIIPILAAALPMFGCQREGKNSTTATAGVLPEVNLATPEDAARSALEYVRAELRAIARDDKQVAEACREQLATIAASRTMQQTLTRSPRLKLFLGDDPVAGYTRNWGAAIAYYAGGLQLDRMCRVSETPSKVVVMVPARGPDDDALIGVSCILEEDEWLVARIGFLPPKTAPAQPASKPASRPL